MANPADFLPLTQTTWCILASLSEEPKHGYAIIKDVERRSDGAVRLGIGNLYITLKRLMDDGLIERAGEREVQGERRKVYRVTGLGVRVVEAERERLLRMMQAAPRLSGQSQEA